MADDSAARMEKATGLRVVDGPPGPRGGRCWRVERAASGEVLQEFFREGLAEIWISGYHAALVDEGKA